MTFAATFDTIGKRVVLSTRIENLSGKDQVELYVALSEILGITERMLAQPDETARAQEIISEQFAKHWGKK